MLTEGTLSVAQAFWAAHLGCSVDELFSAPLHIVTHGKAWADYDGVFAVFREGAAVATVPAERAGSLRELMSPLAQGSSPERLAVVLEPVSALTLGPSYIGYAESVSSPEHPVRELHQDHETAIVALQQTCDPDEWAHGTSDAGVVRAAVFVDGLIAALASYEVWDGVVADHYVITHPDFRGRGFGSSAVAYLARHAVTAGLLPQYRTLLTNQPSIRVAERLGFQQYATSRSVRLRPAL